MNPRDLIKPIETNKNDSGIYMILCVGNQKAYIGSSKNIKNRWSQHSLKKNKHSNFYLQNCYNKYGKYSILYIILENCVGNIREKEASYIEKIDSEFRLNLAGITENIPLAPEIKLRLSEANKGKEPWNKGKINIYSEETKLAMCEHSKGKVLSDEVKLKISVALKGKKKPAFSEEHKAKLYKKLHTPEAVKKMADTKRGKKYGPLSEDHRRKLSESIKAALRRRKDNE